MPLYSQKVPDKVHMLYQGLKCSSMLMVPCRTELVLLWDTFFSKMPYACQCINSCLFDIGDMIQSRFYILAKTQLHFIQDLSKTDQNFSFSLFHTFHLVSAVSAKTDQNCCFLFNSLWMTIIRKAVKDPRELEISSRKAEIKDPRSLKSQSLTNWFIA